MVSKILFAALFGLASCAVPGPYADPYPVVPPQYNYQYGVNDPHYGPVFSQQEERNDYNTAGEYRVNLPDGRVQIVTYSAGPEGYVADVKYEGEAVYPEEKAYAPAPYAAAPAYKPAPAPAYKPAPAPAPYKPAPAPYKPAPAPYKPAPAPYHPAPVVHYKPAPAPYHPAPAPYHPAPYHAAPVYHAAPAYKPAPAYTPKRYGFNIKATPAPEVKAVEAEAVAEAVAEEVVEAVAEEVAAEEAAAAARY